MIQLLVTIAPDQQSLFVVVLSARSILGEGGPPWPQHGLKTVLQACLDDVGMSDAAADALP